MAQERTVPSTSNGHILPVGAEIEVRNRYDGSWASGFEVAGSDHADARRTIYRLRRSSDRSVLPGWFDDEEIRGATREHGWQW